MGDVRSFSASFFALNATDPLFSENLDYFDGLFRLFSDFCGELGFIGESGLTGEFPDLYFIGLFDGVIVTYFRA